MPSHDERAKEVPRASVGRVCPRRPLHNPRPLEDDLRRTARHPPLGPVTLAELLQTWAAHDLNHTVQAERALMRPFMRGCGPWRSFFQDHEIAGAG